jgi:cobalt-zinc-cadmium resistance protein CzcA
MFKLIYSEFLFGNYKLEQIADRDKSDHLGVMVANLNRVRDQGAPLFEAVLLGAGERLRPVLMTASVATVGMLPAALATGVGSDVQRNLATVVAGGLIPATLLTLFIIPTFYHVIERWAARRMPLAEPAVGAA